MLVAETEKSTGKIELAGADVLCAAPVQQEVTTEAITAREETSGVEEAAEVSCAEETTEMVSAVSRNVIDIEHDVQSLSQIFVFEQVDPG